MPTVFYFIRHGDVQNPEQIWYGRMPGYPLSDLGKQQAEQAADFLQTQNINAIYSSPLERTKQTARIIGQKLNLPTIYSDNLLEVRSELQGQTFAYINSINFEIFANGNNRLDAESLDEVGNRINSFLQQQHQDHNGENIIAVSHGDPIMSLKLLHNQLELNLDNLLNKTGEYVHHCEVYKVIYEHEQIQSVIGVFKPNI